MWVCVRSHQSQIQILTKCCSWSNKCPKMGVYEINSVGQCIGHNGLTCVLSTSIVLHWRCVRVWNVHLAKDKSAKKNENGTSIGRKVSERVSEEQAGDGSQSIRLAIDCNIDDNQIHSQRALADEREWKEKNLHRSIDTDFLVSIAPSLYAINTLLPVYLALVHLTFDKLLIWLDWIAFCKWIDHIEVNKTQILCKHAHYCEVMRNRIDFSYAKHS